MLAGARIMLVIGAHDTGTARHIGTRRGWQWVLNGIG